VGTFSGFSSAFRVAVTKLCFFLFFFPHPHPKRFVNRIQSEAIYETALEFKLRGNPFFPEGQETVYSRMVFAQMLSNLRGQGYKLYTSVDISMGQDGMDIESWVFRRVGPAWF
jgi:hypothetical protein